MCHLTSCRTAGHPETRGPHLASCGGDPHSFSSSAAQSSSAKCAHGAQGLAPISARSCPSSRRRSAPSAHSAGATSSPSTRIGDARVRAGTKRGARGASQVVAAPGAHHVRAAHVPPSTPAAMCANPSHPPTILSKFGGASEASRLKSRAEGHARRPATVWRHMER